VQGPGEDGAYRLFVDDKLAVEQLESRDALVNYALLDLPAGPIKFAWNCAALFGDPNVRLGIVNQATVVSPDVATIAGEADAVVVAVGFDPPARARARTAPSACRPGRTC